MTHRLSPGLTVYLTYFAEGAAVADGLTLDPAPTELSPEFVLPAGATVSAEFWLTGDNDSDTDGSAGLEVSPAAPAAGDRCEPPRWASSSTDTEAIATMSRPTTRAGS